MAHARQAFGPISVVVATPVSVSSAASTASARGLPAAVETNVFGVPAHDLRGLDDLKRTRAARAARASSGHVGFPGGSAYSMSKVFAVRALRPGA